MAAAVKAGLFRRIRAIPEVLQEVLNKVHAAYIPAILLDLFQPADGTSCCVAGFFRGHCGGDVFLDLPFQVKLKLTGHLCSI